MDRASNWPFDFCVSPYVSHLLDRRARFGLPPTESLCCTASCVVVIRFNMGRRWVTLTADADNWDDDRDANFDVKGKGCVWMKVMMVMMIMMIMMAIMITSLGDSTKTLTLMPLISVGTYICDNQMMTGSQKKTNLCFVYFWVVSKSFNILRWGFWGHVPGTWSRNGMKRPNQVSGLQFCLEILRCNLAALRGLSWWFDFTPVAQLLSCWFGCFQK